jgi:predicted RNA-binding protein YlqC (UPF0109 family)
MYIKYWLKSVHELCSINHINLASKYNYSSDYTLGYTLCKQQLIESCYPAAVAHLSLARHESDIKRVVTLNTDTMKALRTVLKLLTVNTPKAYLILFSLISIQ